MSEYKYIYATDVLLSAPIKAGDFVRVKKGAKLNRENKGLYLVIGDGLYRGFLKCLRTDGKTIQLNNGVLELVGK